MNKKPNQRIFGMTRTELMILVIMGGIIFCVLAIFAGYIIYTNRSLPVAVLPSISTPLQPTQPSIQLPTETPTIAPPANTPQPTETNLPTETQIPPTATLKPIGKLRVNSWLFEITEVHSDTGMNSSRQQVVLLGNLTNEGLSTDTFVAYSKLILRDSQGRQYEDDQVGTYAAENKYGTQIPSRLNPGATVYIAIAFDAPSSERTFTIIPGSLVVSWSNDITFTLP